MKIFKNKKNKPGKFSGKNLGNPAKRHRLTVKMR